MSIVAHAHPFVVGVDTHARNHVYTILTAATSAVLDTKAFPTTAAGINRALAWIARRTQADADTLWVIEGAASYGAILAGTVAAHGYPVAEAPPNGCQTTPRGRQIRHFRCSQDRGCGSTVTHHETARRPRLSDGVRQAIQILVTARNAMSKDRTRSINALTALVRSNALGLDARAALNKTQLLEVSTWRVRKEELSVSIARAEAIRLAKHVLELDAQLATNEQQLDELVRISEAAPLLEEKGFQAISAAKCLAAWSHHGRISTEAEFASLAGVNPIPASSGNTVRHRLNRGGDRALNSALHMVTVSKMTHDAETRTYAAKRQAERKTNREIRRCLKRYIARRVFRILNAQHKILQPA